MLLRDYLSALIISPMKPQQLAALLNIAPNTLRKWAGTDYATFLSPGAAGFNGASRTFSDQDARILGWVAELKAKNTPAAEILVMLREAQRDNWRTLPPLPGGMANDEPVALMPVEAAEEKIKALRDRYNMELSLIVRERDELKAQLNTVHEENSELQKRLAEITAKEAELRGRLEQYALGGRQLSAVALMTIALLIGSLLAAIFLIAGHFLITR